MLFKNGQKQAFFRKFPDAQSGGFENFYNSFGGVFPNWTLEGGVFERFFFDLVLILAISA